jgi:signal transduction histidine kinase
MQAIELGSLPLADATGSVLKRSITAMQTLIDQAIGEVRSDATLSHARPFTLIDLIAIATASGQLRANALGCRFTVAAVDPQLGVHANYAGVLSALENLLQNAFKFTRAHTEVKLTAYAAGPRVLIDVSDHCGGLPGGDTHKIFIPFFQQNRDRSGVGLGLAMARRAIESDGGVLAVRDMPGVGCVFTISLPRHTLQ